MLALAILSVALMAFGGFMYQMARQTTKSSLLALRSAAQMSATNWAQSLPWDSIPAKVGWAAPDSIGQLVFRRYMSYATTGSWRALTIVINPEGNSAILAPPETLTVTRAKPVSTAPLKVR